jgi:hypothetical protein
LLFRQKTSEFRLGFDDSDEDESSDDESDDDD